jgi:hypothetical protein
MKKKFLTAGLALFVAFSATGCSMFYPNEEPTPTATTTEEPTPTDTPTPTPTLDPDLTKVEINILNTSAFRDNGFIQVIAEALQVMEEDGKCTLKVTQGDMSQSVTVSAEPNVTSTQCFPMEVPVNGFKDGTISYSVTYISGKSTGIADSLKMEIE